MLKANEKRELLKMIRIFTTDLSKSGKRRL
jgi:hypothetical protein